MQFLLLVLQTSNSFEQMQGSLQQQRLVSLGMVTLLKFSFSSDQLFIWSSMKKSSILSSSLLDSCSLRFCCVAAPDLTIATGFVEYEGRFGKTEGTESGFNFL